MSIACVQSCALDGLNAATVVVEAHMANGLPSFTLVGLPEAEVRESRERVRAALQTCHFEWPSRRITVNLAPADIPKESGRFDLPIALAILAASGQIPVDAVSKHIFAGELSLTGELRDVRGALAMVAGASRVASREPNTGEHSTAAVPHVCKPFVLPQNSAIEAAQMASSVVYGALTLPQVVKFICGQGDLPRASASLNRLPQQYPDLADVKGQHQAKRALEVAASGGHGILLIGPPGTGKSMLAQRFVGILPAMDEAQSIESAAVLSLAGQFDPLKFGQRVFRSPHHTASGVALVGGGSVPRPGEVSLAHHGVLFLDELPEFDRGVLEVLREPLEVGKITISRATRRADFPAKFQLVAAMNPCPCGYLGHAVRQCRCSPDQVARYQNKISGPLLDRIDIHMAVPALAEGELLNQAKNSPRGETSAAVALRATAARQFAFARQGCTNAALEGEALETHCALDTAAHYLLQAAMNKLGLSARAAHRVLRLSRTLADLADSRVIRASDIAEAVQYRRGLRTGGQ
jgi:magnesium chelatase family protein